MKKPLLIITICCALISNSFAQKNTIKLNLLALGLTNISLQEEYSLSGKSSICLGFSYLPSRGLPGFAIKKDDTGNAESFALSGFSITPEYRYYFKGNGPKGFYVAPYLRYAKYNTNKFSFEYGDNNDKTSTLTGSYKVTVFGIMLGSQWLLGDKFTLDWWIVGAGFGSQEGEYTATGTFSAEDQADFQDEVSSTDNGAVKISAETSASQISFKIEPKFPAFRGFGLCLGYRF